MKFSKLAGVLEELEKTSSNNKMQEIAAGFLKKVPAKNIGMVAHFMAGEIAPAHADVDIGMAEKMTVRAIAAASGKKEERVKKIFKKEGDIGLAAETFSRNRGKLTVKEVFEKLHEIANTSGEGSQEKKVQILSSMLKKAGKKEARYLARIVAGKLRLGASVKTIIYALAIAFTGSKKNKDEIERAYDVNPDIGAVAEKIAKEGIKGAKRAGAVIGRPIKMMLCQRVKKLEDIKKKMDRVSVEEKLDGERIQAHCSHGRVVLFSRRMENITKQYPDVAEACKKNVRAKKYIIEGEAIPVDSKGNFRPFQLLMKRRRKYNIEKYMKEIPVCYFVFDVLYLTNKSYLQEPYPVRRKAVEKIIKNTNRIQAIKNRMTSNIKDIKKFFDWSVKRGSEGVVIKSCRKNSVYRAGVRAWQWIKWKKEYAEGMRETFDLVVVGGFAGKGKRKKTYGSLLCAAYNQKKGKFETFCKLGSGFTDKQLAELPRKFKKYEVRERPKNIEVIREMKPDVWFRPNIVVEVLGAEITKSPLHSCGKKNGKGLALRFPRFLRYREDKNAEQATTVKEIEAMV